MPPIDKVLFGTAGVVGTSAIAWRNLFPWIGDDIIFLKKSKEAIAITDKHIADGKMIVDLFEEDVLRTPKKPFIIFEDRIYTYELVNDQANRVASLASQWGSKVGDTVAIMIGNEPAFIWTYIGLQKLGIAVAFINYNIKKKALVHSLKSCDAKVLIIGKDEEIFHAVDEIRKEISETPVYVQGLPKPVIVHQRKILTYAIILLLTDFRDRDIMYTSNPLYHSMAGRLCLMGIITIGDTMVLRRKFSAHRFWEDVRKNDITYIQYVGEMFRYLLALPQDKIMMYPPDLRHPLGGTSLTFPDLCLKHLYADTIYAGLDTVYKIMLKAQPRCGYGIVAREISVFLNAVHSGQAYEVIVKGLWVHPLDGVHKVKAVVGNGLRQDIWEKFQTRFRVPRIYETFGSTEGMTSTVNTSNRVGSCGRISPILNRFELIPKYIIEVDPITGDPVRDKDGHCKQVKRGRSGLAITGIPEDYAGL